LLVILDVFVISPFMEHAYPGVDVVSIETITHEVSKHILYI